MCLIKLQGVLRPGRQTTNHNILSLANFPRERQAKANETPDGTESTSEKVLKVSPVCVSPVPGLSALTPEPDRTPDGQPVPEAVKGGTAVYAYCVSLSPNSELEPRALPDRSGRPGPGRGTGNARHARCSMLHAFV